jgi:hypothetical protein
MSTVFLTHAEILVSFISVSFKRALGVALIRVDSGLKKVRSVNLFIGEKHILSNELILQLTLRTDSFVRM